MSIYGKNYLLEYKGNEADNENFADCMKELDTMFSYYIEIIKAIRDHVDYTVTATKKCKSSSQFKKAMNDIFKDADKTNDKVKALYDKFEESPNYRRFQYLIKKFSVKYSNVTMEEKKKYAEKFIKVHKDMIDLVEKYDDNWVNEINDKEIPRLRGVDYTIVRDWISHLNPWYQALYRYFGYMHNNVLYVIYKLDTASENKLKYKLVQAIFKDKE